MKGRSVFTPEEAILIKSTLNACREAGRYSNQDQRNNLRKRYKFYISDFDHSLSGFTSVDFDYQVSIGNIKIEDGADVNFATAFVNFDYKSDRIQDRFEKLAYQVENHTYISKDHKEMLVAMLKEVKKRIHEMIVDQMIIESNT